MKAWRGYLKYIHQNREYIVLAILEISLSQNRVHQIYQRQLSIRYLHLVMYTESENAQKHFPFSVLNQRQITLSKRVIIQRRKLLRLRDLRSLRKAPVTAALVLLTQASCVTRHAMACLAPSLRLLASLAYARLRCGGIRSAFGFAPRSLQSRSLGHRSFVAHGSLQLAQLSCVFIKKLEF